MKLGLTILSTLLATTAFAEGDFTTVTHTTPDGWNYEFMEVPQSKGWKIAIAFPTDLQTSGDDVFVSWLGPNVITYSGYEGMDRADVAAQLENIQSNADFGFADTFYYLDVFLNEDEIDKITELFPKIMYQSSYEQVVLDDTRDDIVDNLERYFLDTGGQLAIMQQTAMLHNSGIKGNLWDYSVDAFDSISMDDVKTWFETVQTHGGMKIAVAGKDAPENAEALIDGLLQGFDQASEARAEGNWKLDSTARRWVLESPELDKSAINISAVFDSDVTDAEMQILNFVSAALNGLDGRLNSVIREELRASYGFRGFISRDNTDNTSLFVNGETSTELTQESLAAVSDVISELKANGITQDEFDAHVKEVQSYLADARNDENNMAEELILRLIEPNSEQTLQEYVAQFEALTIEDVNAVIKAKLPEPSQFITMIVTPTAEGLNADCVIADLSEVEGCL